jgi:hypothetical protein
MPLAKEIFAYLLLEGFAKPHKSSRSTGRWRGILNCDAIYRLLKDTDHDYV